MTGVLLASAVLVLGAEPAEDTSRRLALQLARMAADSRTLPAVRLEALRTLQRLDADARAAVPQLIEMLDRPLELPDITERVAATLGFIGPPARAALPALTRVVGRDIDIDLAVRRAVERITAPPDAVEIQELMREMRSGEPGRRLRAAKGIAAKGLRAEEAVPDLLALLRDADGDVRRMAVIALRAVEPGSRHATSIAEAYVVDLNDVDENVRLIAARMLGKLGPAAANAAPALQKAQADASEDVRRAAAEALGKIGLPPSQGPIG